VLSGLEPTATRPICRLHRRLLAQPFFPGVGGNATASDTSALDPHYKPQRTDNFTLSIQRQITQKSILEVGYIAACIKNETLATNLDAVFPIMMTLGGQTFAQAFASTFFASHRAAPRLATTDFPRSLSLRMLSAARPRPAARRSPAALLTWPRVLHP